MDTKHELVTFNDEYKLQGVFKVPREILLPNNRDVALVRNLGYP
jgi:hypothetical protein